MGKSTMSVREFALIGFLLLAVLFGMQIMTFIFGNLESVNPLADLNQTIQNRTSVHINGSTYTIPEASDINFTGGFRVIEAINVSEPTLPIIIPAANFTVDAARGIIVNSTETIYDSVNLSYDYTYETLAESLSREVNNDSLTAIGNYAEQSGTQFTTLGIAITLIILVAVFLFFWIAFMGKKSSPSGASRGAKSSRSLGGGSAFG